MTIILILFQVNDLVCPYARVCIRSLSTKGCAKREGERGRNGQERERESHYPKKYSRDRRTRERKETIHATSMTDTHRYEIISWESGYARVRTAVAALLTSNFVWFRWTALNSVGEIRPDRTKDLCSSSSWSSFPSSLRTINEYWSEPSLLVEEISFVYLYTLD